MYINIDVPLDLLSSVDDAARKHAMKRPEFVRYLMSRFVALGYPIVDVDFICPDCAQGKHCRGVTIETLIDLKSLAGRGGSFGQERSLRWVCRCRECSEAKGEVSASATVSAG